MNDEDDVRLIYRNKKNDTFKGKWTILYKEIIWWTTGALLHNHFRARLK